MPIIRRIIAEPSRVFCERVAPSPAAELAWLLDLLVQSAPYAEPALDELDRSLLPGVAALRPSLKDRFLALWNDEVAGCPELLVAGAVGGMEHAEAGSLLIWLSALPKDTASRLELLTETASDRRRIRRRLVLLDSDVRLRRAYRNILAEVWDLARPTWERRGRAVAAKAATEWSLRLSGIRTAPELLRLMPPRHPLTDAAPFRRRRRFVLVPIFFCMSGGQVADLDSRLHIGVPASALEPVRRARDAAFVADRMRTLAEPTRVRVLIHLMSAPAGVMELSRALRISQPSVSEHVRVLTAAGLVRRTTKGHRSVYAAAPRRFERLLEDARATLARWT